MTTTTTTEGEGEGGDDRDLGRDELRRLAEACDALIRRGLPQSGQTALYLDQLDRVRADPARLRALLSLLHLLKALVALDAPAQAASRAADEEGEYP